jgi:hypothetical protein
MSLVAVSSYRESRFTSFVKSEKAALRNYNYTWGVNRCNFVNILFGAATLSSS